MVAKQFERVAFIALLAAALASLVFALFAAPQNWVSTASVLTGLAGIVQLEISGLFEHWIEKYGDADRYPYGPPSHITRQIIDDPDRLTRTWLRNTVFFDKKTGFRLIVLGGMLQLFSIWL
jgi:hypothetical protein